MKWKHLLGFTLTAGLAAASIPGAMAPAFAAPTSQLIAGSVASAAVDGAIDYTVYLPAGYDESAATRYPTLYLLHGRGDTQAAWQHQSSVLDELIEAGSIPAMVVIMPDAPWSSRGNYYVDSLYTGGSASPGMAVETAFTTDLIAHIDESYATIDDRESRAVGGYSMGGAGALRYVTAHQDLFGSAIALSPAVYVPSPPLDSSTREFGAYGSESALYDDARYQALNYPSTFASFDPQLPVHLFIAVGDDEWANPLPEDAIHDLDYEAATLYNHAKRVPGMTSELRVYDGGHDWDVWDTGFREGILNISSYLRTAPAQPFEGRQFGSGGDDRSGGVLGRTDGSLVQALNADGDMLGHTSQGGYDILLQKLASDGTQEWLTPIATGLNDRAYGVVDGGDGAVITAGFQRRDHAGASNDDVLAVKVDADGTELWRTTFGSEAAADRAYGVASDGEGGAYVTGYTSGALPGGSSAGDKDAFIAKIDADGSVAWTQQFGSSGEDKGLAVARSADGGVYVGGLAGGSMPGSSSAGGYDGWVAKFTADGTREWLSQLGSSSTDQVSALIATATGVAATGFTGGDLGGESLGDNDVFIAALDAAGTVQWLTHDGSSGDDRGAAITLDASGNLLVVGHTSGAIGTPSGGVDVFSMAVSPTGTVGERAQFGSVARDGADEWDEANLYIAGGGSTWVQALTYGSVDGAASNGSGDIALTRLSFDAVVDGASAPGIVPGATTPAGGPSFGPLAFTGSDLVPLALLSMILISAGFILRKRRRWVNTLG
ncbi:alpha/beta hydrolase-fold protein [Rhodoglobus sp. NPDC076762]